MAYLSHLAVFNLNLFNYVTYISVCVSLDSKCKINILITFDQTYVEIVCAKSVQMTLRLSGSCVYGPFVLFLHVQ